MMAVVETPISCKHHNNELDRCDNGGYSSPGKAENQSSRFYKTLRSYERNPKVYVHSTKKAQRSGNTSRMSSASQSPVRGLERSNTSQVSICLQDKSVDLYDTAKDAAPSRQESRSNNPLAASRTGNFEFQRQSWTPNLFAERPPESRSSPIRSL